MANIRSINGNPIVVGASGIEDGAVNYDKLDDGVKAKMRSVEYGEVDIDFVQGNRSTSAIDVVVSSTTRLVSTVIDAKTGDRIVLTGEFDGIKAAVAGVSSDGATEYDSGWRDTDYSYNIASDGKYFVRVAKTNGLDEITTSDIDFECVYYADSLAAVKALSKVTTLEIDSFDEVTDMVFSNGYWGVSDGKLVSDAGGWCRSVQSINDTIASIEVKEGAPLKIFILAYEGNTYIGCWFGASFSKVYDSQAVINHADMSFFKSQYPNYTFRLDITKTVGGSLTPQYCSDNLLIKKSRNKIPEIEIQSIYGDIAKANIWENGTINSAGEKSTSVDIHEYRLSTNRYLRLIVPITISPKDGYSISVTTYTKEGIIYSQFSAWENRPYTIQDTDKLYKIVIKNNDGLMVNPDSVSEYIETSILHAVSFNRMLSEISNVKTVNHRGYNAIAPENTLTAYELSAQLGYKYVETDVLFTSDGVAVLMHDDTINRTARNADGTQLASVTKIEDITYEQALQYDYGIYKGQQYAGTKIPTFAEFMDCCRALNLHPWIELKWTHEYTQGEITDIISTIKLYGMEEHVTFISFSADALGLVKDEWDSVELGLNGSVTDAESLKTSKNRVFMIYNQTDTSYVDAVNAGFQICFYTVDTDDSLLQLPTQAFDSILTNAILPNQTYDVVHYGYVERRTQD